jgi:hypothetical protein
MSLGKGYVVTEELVGLPTILYKDPNRRSGLVADDGLTLTKGWETPKYWGSVY